MLDRTDFASWQQRIRLYCRGKDNGVNILKSIDEGPYILGTFRETLAESTEGTPQFGPERPCVYFDLNSNEQDRYNADIRATNILLQGLLKDIYTLINHYTDAKDIWDNVKMLIEGSKLTKEDRESQLYDDFEHFRQHKEESINDYYVRITSVIPISLDSSKESVGTSTARVILFGMIPTAILTTVTVVDPLVISTLPHTSSFLYTDLSDNDTFERPPSHNLYEILPVPPSLPHRQTVLILPGQPIPIGRPYRTQPNRVYDSSSDLSSGYSSDISSSHYIPNSPFDTLAATSLRPSCMRRRIGGSISANDFKVCSEEIYEPYTEPHIDSNVQADIDAGITDSDDIAAREMGVRVEIGVDAATEIDIPYDLLMPDAMKRPGKLEE
nr:retrovirus-related Pol polyprotein from transposon TNT 1-94 [Tanacetum cinerariifolium]